MSVYRSAGRRVLVVALLVVMMGPSLARAAGPGVLYLPLAAGGAAAVSQVRLTPVASGLTGITGVTHAGDGDPQDGRLFIVQQGGQIRILEDGALLAAPFLDISARIASGGERGLLGLAFHPDFAANGYFYVNYTFLAAGDGLRSRVARFTISGDPDVADAGSETAIIEFAQPFDNHNGGALHFGPDGYLYIATGDGGGSYDPQDNSQDAGNLLGKILRIDVDATGSADCGIAPGRSYGIPAGNPLADGAGGACDEIWAYGLRNPWRFSFDRLTGDVWIADVGQASREEIDFQPAGSPGGQNYGWDCWEGTLQNPTGRSPACAANPPTAAPVHEYDHAGGRCSITGGYVHRGTSQPRLNGLYFFADYCSGELWALRPTGGAPAVTEMIVTGAVLSNPRTFGQDANGELFVASPAAVFRITAE